MDLSRRHMVTAVTFGLASTAVQSTASAAGAAPDDANALPSDDARRHGLVPNDPAAAAANTSAIRALCSPEVDARGFVGRLRFPNSTGSDIYHFNDVITFRDGINLDLQHCTLKFTKIGADPNAANAGFIYAVRDFSIENGAIEVQYADAGDGQGNAIALGSRNAAGLKYFPNQFDKMMPRSQGNILLRNLRITSNNPNARLILAMGGLENVSFENLTLDGRGVCDGIYYEFGWATFNPKANQRETSHARNLRFSNIVINNIKRTSPASGIALNGAFSVWADGISVNGGYSALSFGTGESLFFRPSAGVDDIGAKHNISVRNLVAQNLSGTAVEFTGANRASGGYLGSLRLDPAAQTDLIDCSIDGFAIDSAEGYGIRSSAGRLSISNGRISRCQRGIVTTDECTWFSISDVAVIDNTGIGIQIGQGVNIYDPPRQKMGSIRNCFIAGNSTAAAAANAAIQLTHCRSVLIENNRIGYETRHDGRDENTQGSAINANGADTYGIRCVSNHVAGAAGNSPAYVLSLAGTNGRGCTIERPSGVATRRGLWGDGVHQLDSPAFDALIRLDCQLNNEFIITATDTRAFTIDAPTNAAHGQRITVTIRNASRGGIGSCNWNPEFKMSGWDSPGAGHGRSIEFMYNGANWLEIGRSSQDIPL